MTCLYERMKQYEDNENVENYQSFLVRVDGKKFSTFTKKYFKKPFDPHFTSIMKDTANELLCFFNPTLVYVCSDEITLIFMRKYAYDDWKNSEFKKEFLHTHPFNGRKEKLTTLIASKTSVIFNRRLKEVLKETTFSASDEPIFDGKFICFDCSPEKENEEIINYLAWRSRQTYANCVSSVCKNVSGGNQKAMQCKGVTEMIQMMKREYGFDFETEISSELKYGCFCKKVEVRKAVFSDLIGDAFCWRNVPYNFVVDINGDDYDDTACQTIKDSLISAEPPKALTAKAHSVCRN